MKKKRKIRSAFVFHRPILAGVFFLSITTAVYFVVFFGSHFLFVRDGGSDRAPLGTKANGGRRGTNQ